MYNKNYLKINTINFDAFETYDEGDELTKTYKKVLINCVTKIIKVIFNELIVNQSPNFSTLPQTIDTDKKFYVGILDVDTFANYSLQ